MDPFYLQSIQAIKIQGLSTIADYTNDTLITAGLESVNGNNIVSVFDSSFNFINGYSWISGQWGSGSPRNIRKYHSNFILSSYNSSFFNMSQFNMYTGPLCQMPFTPNPPQPFNFPTDTFYTAGAVNYSVTGIFNNLPAGGDILGHMSNCSANYVHEENFYSIKVYPNPTRNYLNVKINEDRSAEFIYWVFDATGKKIKSGCTKVNDLTIDCSQLPGGLYNIFIEGNDFIHSKHFIVERN